MLDDLSIVVPSKNEFKNLQFILPKLKKFSSDIIVSDSLSNDGTESLCKKMRVNFTVDYIGGKGVAQMIGAKKAKNKYIIFFDSDGSHNENDIPRIYKLIKKNDLVLCSRQSGGSYDLNFNLSFTGLIRATGCLFLTYLFNKLFSTEFTDILYSFRAAKKKSLFKMKLSEKKFGIEIDMITSAVRKNMKVVEIPSRENKRVYGLSKLNTISGIYFIYQTIRDFLFKK